LKYTKKIMSAFVLLSTFFSLCMAANAAEYSVDRSSQRDKITISGTMEKDEMFSVQILKNGVTPEDIEKDYSLGADVSVFSKTLSSDEDGAFSFDVKLAQTGEYVVYIRAMSEKEPISEKFAFVLESEKESVVSEVTEKLNKGEDVDIISYLKDFFCDDTAFINDLKKYVSSEAQQEYFLEKMQKRNIRDDAGLKTAAKEALVLAVAKNSDGPKNLKDVMRDYNDVLNISSLTNKISVYTAIAGEYADISDFKAAYKKAADSSSDSSSGGGSGGSGGGGGSNASGTYAKVNVGSVQVGSAATTDKNIVPINIKFEDLASVEWAYKDISELFDKGIVNGVSEHLFRPNISVKREEFAKMLVCAMGLQNESVQSAGFTDVESGAWYESYVNIAKSFGISNGTGYNNFGVGAEISRQDMAVMIFNSMKLCGIESISTENTFADRGSCAEYAVDAIAELCAKGIVSGIGDNTFDPLGVATRAQATVMINRALPYLSKEAVK